MKKKLQKTGKFTKKTTSRFQISPSKIPNKIKVLEEEDSKLKEVLLNDPNVYLLNSYNLVSNYILNMYSLVSDNPRWLSYSKTLKFIYDIRSVNCYINGCFILEDSRFYRSVELLSSNLYNHLKDTKKLKRINNTNLTTTCRWFVYGLYRSVRYDKVAMTYTRKKGLLQQCGLYFIL